MAKTPQLILAGGGDAADSRPLDERFAAWAGGGPLLYLPLALDEREAPYDGCMAWLRSVFEPLGLSTIELWHDLASHDHAELRRFSAIYIGGGNTFRLLALLRAGGFDRALDDYIAAGGPVYGGSAGAIVLGRDIMTAAHADPNEVGLTETHGLDRVARHAVWCHYTTADDANITAYIARHGHSVLALPERGGLRVAGGHIYAAGYEPSLRFTAKGKQALSVGGRL